MHLKGKTIAIVVADFFQPLEYWYPYLRMKEEGAVIKQVSRGRVHTTRHGYPSAEQDLTPEQARAADFDALIVPGGFAPDAMRQDLEILRLVRELDQAGKLIAAICHGPWVPVAAGIAHSRAMTSFPSIRADLVNAGAMYKDERATRDGNLITSRTPEDLPAFCDSIVAALTQKPQKAFTAAGKRVAILTEDFHDYLQFWVPYYRLLEAGAEVKVVCKRETHLSGNALPGNYPSQKQDLLPAGAHGADFDAVIVPGGYAPDYIRADRDMVRFVREMDAAGKLVATICRGAWVSITAGIVRGRGMTCAPAIRTDLVNAGADHADVATMRDGNFITGRSSQDLPEFCREIAGALTTSASAGR